MLRVRIQVVQVVWKLEVLVLVLVAVVRWKGEHVAHANHAATFRLSFRVSNSLVVLKVVQGVLVVVQVVLEVVQGVLVVVDCQISHGGSGFRVVCLSHVF